MPCDTLTDYLIEVCVCVRMRVFACVFRPVLELHAALLSEPRVADVVLRMV